MGIIFFLHIYRFMYINGFVFVFFCSDYYSLHMASFYFLYTISWLISYLHFSHLGMKITSKFLNAGKSTQTLRLYLEALFTLTLLRVIITCCFFKPFPPQQ